MAALGRAREPVNAFFEQGFALIDEYKAKKRNSARAEAVAPALTPGDGDGDEKDDVEPRSTAENVQE